MGYCNLTIPSRDLATLPQYKQLGLEHGVLSGFYYVYAYVAISHTFSSLFCHCLALLADDTHRAD